MMKRNLKKTMALLLALMLLMSSAASAWAAAVETVTAQLRPDFTIIIDGSERTFYTAAGEEVYPILYNGTTYLPLRAIGEVMGKNVNWDQATKTITLYGSRSVRTTGVKGDLTYAKSITATLRGDFTLAIDGTERRFTDVNGNTLYPLLYDGTTYLPLRAIGQLMGKNVGWNSTTNTVTLTSKDSIEDPLVTDADSFTSANIPETDWGNYIGLSEAKRIALADAGLKTNQVTFVQTQLDKDNSIWQYEIEFYTPNGKEYDYSIDALTGKIRSVDYEAEHHTAASGEHHGQYIGVSQAKEKALDRAGLTTSQATFTKAELDREDGRMVYELKFYAGSKKYECDVDALNGQITDWEMEYDD